MKRLLALLALLLAAGCGSQESSGPPATAPSSPEPIPPGVSTTAPVVPYLLKGRVHLPGGAEAGGRYASLTVRGDAWLAWPRAGERAAWGTAAAAHRLPRGVTARLSTNGRYLVTADDKGCMGDAFKPGGNTCTLSFIDTSGATKPRRLVKNVQQLNPQGVTDDGMVLLEQYVDRGWDEVVWDAAHGARDVRPLVVSAPLRTWAMQGWETTGFGHAGFEFRHGEDRWLGTIVGGEVRPLHRIPADAEPGPGGTWFLGARWSRSAAPPGPVRFATTPALRLRHAGDETARVTMQAPAGWRFAPATYPELVIWEDADTFLARIVDARKGGDRLVRCDLPLAACAMVR